jgi:hypothetical protein
LSELSKLADHYQKLIDKPTVNALLVLTHAMELWGFPDEARGTVSKVVQSLRSATADMDEQVIHAALTFAAGVAVQACDEKLADLIADVSIELSGSFQRLKVIAQVFFRIVECAGAYQNRDEGIATLARQLEYLASVALQSELNNVLGLLTTLQGLDDKLAMHLGRAIAVARLGAKSAA